VSVTPQLWVFAGPNGAGKSTLVAQRVRGRIPTVNPDEIALTLPAAQGPAGVIAAGRVALAQREAHLAAGRTFGLETTLTGRSELDLMRRARGAGYSVNFVFVGLDDVQLSASRVYERVGKGGHDVPLADVLRRFDRSMGNLAIALPIADRAFVLDNSGSRRRLLLSRENEQTRFLAQQLPKWAADAIPAAMQTKSRSHSR
jgi:predicted ABC-type ATPase